MHSKAFNKTLLHSTKDIIFSKLDLICAEFRAIMELDWKVAMPSQSNSQQINVSRRPKNDW